MKQNFVAGKTTQKHRGNSTEHNNTWDTGMMHVKVEGRGPVALDRNFLHCCFVRKEKATLKAR